MDFLYNATARFAWLFLQLAAIFNHKLNLFVKGRKKSFDILRQHISKDDFAVWVHVASLGEFEQGLPIIEEVKTNYPHSKIMITFFSPSGYEVKKHSTAADVICYLPFDTKTKAQKFLELADPKLAIFVKYEIWPNYIKLLHEKQIPTLIVSAIFRERQIYFKPYGGFMRNALRKIDHFFVQDERSQELLASIGIKNSTLSGDTRLDRVSKILDRDNSLDFMAEFKGSRHCFIAGSTWPEDEEIIVDYINNNPKNLKFVLAPHTIKSDKVLGLAGSITKKTLLYSKMEDKDLNDYEVLIVDHIGLLTKIYSYADIAYVGGGFSTGLHNTLEPAVFGIPVIIGPNYSGFNEAEELVAKRGILSIKDAWSFGEVMKKLVQNDEFRKRTGTINSTYISKNKGATNTVIDYIQQLPF